MMHFSCPSCGTIVSAPEDCAGRTTRCRQCGHSITVPPKTPPPPGPPIPREKTSIGKLISHVPTGLQSDITTPQPPARPSTQDPTKPRTPAHPPALSRGGPAGERGTSKLSRIGLSATFTALAIATGGLFGYGLYRYLDSGKKDHESNEPVATVTDKAAKEKLPRNSGDGITNVLDFFRARDKAKEELPRTSGEVPGSRNSSGGGGESSRGGTSIPSRPEPPSSRAEEPPQPPVRKEHLPRKEDIPSPPPTRVEPPPTVVGSPPGTKDDSTPIRRERPTAAGREVPPPKKEDLELPRQLRLLVAQLKKGTAEQKVKAADDLAGIGEKAQPAARALCEAAMDPSQEASRSALQALEKVHPNLYQPVFILLVDAQARNHRQALSKLKSLGEQAKPAVPILFQRIKRCQEQLVLPQSAWGQPTLVEITSQIMETLGKVAPEDPEVVKTVIDLSKFTTPQVLFVPRVRGKRAFGRQFTTTPFRNDGVHLLGEIAEGQPQHRKQIIPPLVSLLKESVQGTKATQEDLVLQAIEEVEQAGNALLKCGPEAKQALGKEVVPRLKDLKFHPSDKVRVTAEELRKKIEDTP